MEEIHEDAKSFLAEQKKQVNPKDDETEGVRQMS